MDKTKTAKKHLMKIVTKAFIPAFISLFFAVLTYILAVNVNVIFYIFNMLSIAVMLYLSITIRSNYSFYTRMIHTLDKVEPLKLFEGMYKNMTENLDNGEFNSHGISTGYLSDINKKGKNIHIEKELQVLKEVIDILK